MLKNYGVLEEALSLYYDNLSAINISKNLVILGTNKISKYDYHNISILFILTKYV